MTSLAHPVLSPGAARVAVRRSPAALVAVEGGAVLAIAIGVGRFVYTPILPLMQDQAGLSSAGAASLATANYAGYLVGALAGVLAPALVHSVAALRACLLAIVASLALMPMAVGPAEWSALRLAAGAASALAFVIAVDAMLERLRGRRAHLVGWAFGGAGAGIALSGVLVLALRPVTDWRTAWWAAAALALVLSALAWGFPAGSPAQAAGATTRAARRWFAAVLAAYTLEGIGYIIAGTFLVAAIEQGSGRGAGGGAWVLVGVAELPSAALWAWLGTRRSRPVLLVAALSIQAAGIALPALVGGIVPALAGAVLFGATFIGIGALSMAVGAHLRFPRSVAILTAGYSAGQVLGPLVVTPLLGDGYGGALLVGAGLVAAGALAAGVLGVGYPERVAA